MTGPMASPSDPLWVITSYYNPAGYRRRLQNFRAVRRHLTAPLLVVELTPDGHGALHDDDADMVLRLSGDDRIWQKERLLNIATAMLPPHVSHVAWVDADLLFSDPDWPARARAVLDAHGGMMQLFDTAYHLAPDIDPQTVDIAQCAEHKPLLTGISFARSIREGRFDTLEDEWGKRSIGEAITSDLYNVRGFAWAARRDTLRECGLYEGNVVGGSDSIVALALVGQIERTWVRRPYTKAHRAHALQWAAKAHDAGLFAHIGDLPQTAWHLWHGTLANRRYAARYHILAGNDYDPTRDVVFDQGQPLRWANPGSALSKAVGEYFFSRLEDSE